MHIQGDLVKSPCYAPHFQTPKSCDYSRITDMIGSKSNDQESKVFEWLKTKTKKQT